MNSEIIDGQTDWDTTHFWNLTMCNGYAIMTGSSIKLRTFTQYSGWNNKIYIIWLLVQGVSDMHDNNKICLYKNGSTDASFLAMAGKITWLKISCIFIYRAMLTLLCILRQRAEDGRELSEIGSLALLRPTDCWSSTCVSSYIFSRCEAYLEAEGRHFEARI